MYIAVKYKSNFKFLGWVLVLINYYYYKLISNFFLFGKVLLLFFRNSYLSGEQLLVARKRTDDGNHLQ